MQPPTAPPRNTLTEAAVVALIQDAPAVQVYAGCELVDQALNVVADISDDLVGGSVSRSGLANLHGTAELTVSAELDWGQAILRPYLVMYDDVTTARFNLGAYYTSTPKRNVVQAPRAFDVQGYDILHGLADPVGDAYAVAAGTSYLAAVEAILTARGYTGYLIDQSSVASVLPSARVWPLDERITWLTVVNDLLASIGYWGIWSDWDGRLRCEAYQSPLIRPVEWVYTGYGTSSMLGPERIRERDYFEAPNRWVAVRSNQIEGAAPVQGNGVYTFVNQTSGDASVDARGGRVITRILQLDVADHAALVAAAQISIDADMRLPDTITCSTWPNPLHWHFDRLLIDDPELGPPVDVTATKWTLPLNGSDQQHEWNCI